MAARSLALRQRSAVISRQFLLFLTVSSLAAVANVSSRALFSHWVAYPSAIVLAFGVGMATAFALNRLFVFRRPASGLRHQMFWFVTVNLLALGQTLLVSLALARLVLPLLGFSTHAETIAHALGVTAPAISSFLLHKHLTFRARA